MPESAGYVRFDRQSDLLLSLYVFRRNLELMQEKPDVVKFAYIAAHSSVQAALTIALHKGNSFESYRDKDFGKWYPKFREGNLDENTEWPKLDYFMNLFDKVFPQNPPVERDLVERFHNRRNAFEHFNIDGMSFLLETLIEELKVAVHTVRAASCATQSIFFYEEEDEEAFNVALSDLDAWFAD